MLTAAAAYPSTELARFGRELHSVRREAAELLDGLSPAQLAWTAEPGRWSVGENVSHLRTLNTRYLESIDRAIAEASGYASGVSLKAAFRQFVGATPREARERGAFETVASAFAQELFRLREAARDQGRPEKTWLN